MKRRTETQPSHRRPHLLKPPGMHARQELMLLRRLGRARRTWSLRKCIGSSSATDHAALEAAD